MTAVALYLAALFFIGLGNAVATYHILRYRDPDDLSAVVLVAYFILVFIILVLTAFLVDWTELFGFARF